MDCCILRNPLAERYMCLMSIQSTNLAEENKSHQSQDLNLGPLGEKRKCYLCAMQHPLNAPRVYFKQNANELDLGLAQAKNIVFVIFAVENEDDCFFFPGEDRCEPDLRLAALGGDAEGQRR